MSKPNCPRCNRKGKPIGGGMYVCSFGHRFDDNPDEGGTHDSRNPAARIEREETMQDARHVNDQRRGQASRPFRFARN